MKNNVIQVDFVNRKRKGLIPILWVKSDNFEGYITNNAYRDLLMSMSTGDYNTHIKETRWFKTAEIEELIEYNQITFDLTRGE